MSLGCVYNPAISPSQCCLPFLPSHIQPLPTLNNSPIFTHDPLPQTYLHTTFKPPNNQSSCSAGVRAFTLHLTLTSPHLPHQTFTSLLQIPHNPISIHRQHPTNISSNPKSSLNTHQFTTRTKSNTADNLPAQETHKTPTSRHTLATMTADPTTQTRAASAMS